MRTPHETPDAAAGPWQDLNRMCYPCLMGLAGTGRSSAAVFDVATWPRDLPMVEIDPLKKLVWCSGQSAGSYQRPKNGKIV